VRLALDFAASLPLVVPEVGVNESEHPIVYLPVLRVASRAPPPGDLARPPPLA
jgi:hypothetical protein